MKKKGMILSILALGLLALFSQGSEVQAIPGIGGTITKACTYTLCVANCFSAGADLEGIPISLEGGGTYITVSGSERSCGDQWAFCS